MRLLPRHPGHPLAAAGLHYRRTASTGAGHHHADGAAPLPSLRGYRAAKGHVWDNLLLWVGAFAAAGALAAAMRWGTAAAVCAMLVGILVMMVAEKGIVLTREPPAADEAVADDKTT